VLVVDRTLRRTAMPEMSSHKFSSVLSVIEKRLRIRAGVVAISKAYISSIRLRRPILFQTQRSDARSDFGRLKTERAKVIRDGRRRLFRRSRWYLLVVTIGGRKGKLPFLNDLHLHILGTSGILRPIRRCKETCHHQEKCACICRLLVCHVDQRFSNESFATSSNSSSGVCTA